MSDLVLLDNVERLLAEARTPEDLKRLLDGFSAVEWMAKRTGAQETQVKAWGAKMRAEAASAVYYSQLQDDPGGGDHSLPRVTSAKQQAEETLGVTRKTLSGWLPIARKMRKEPGRLEEFQALCLVDNLDPTAKGFVGGAHISNNSGDNEWYTPEFIIEKARAVMGSIDLDPASTKKANEIVQASLIYTEDDDGLGQAWAGNVWMNPPYAKEWINQFCEKLCAEFIEGDVTQAIVLVNNATETKWGQAIQIAASAFALL